MKKFVMYAIALSAVALAMIAQMQAVSLSAKSDLPHPPLDGVRPVCDQAEPTSADGVGFAMDGVGPAMSFPVAFTGQRPTIVDFVQAIADRENPDSDYDEHLAALHTEWHHYRAGQPTQGTFDVDSRNGFVSYVSEMDGYRSVTEFCYWICADQQRRIVAMADNLYYQGRPEPGQFSGLTLFTYDPATRRLTYVNPSDYGIDLGDLAGVPIFNLPRQGKDIRLHVTPPNGAPYDLKYTWVGNGFRR